jgi:hypothetical protein
MVVISIAFGVIVFLLRSQHIPTRGLPPPEVYFLAGVVLLFSYLLPNQSLSKSSNPIEPEVIAIRTSRDWMGILYWVGAALMLIGFIMIILVGSEGQIAGGLSSIWIFLLGFGLIVVARRRRAKQKMELH